MQRNPTPFTGRFGRLLVNSASGILVILAALCGLPAGTASAAGTPPRPHAYTQGAVLPYGDATDYGSLSGSTLNAPLTAMARAPAGQGYWLTAADGGVFAFGDAQFYGSMGGQPLGAPVVGIAATPDGKGYWLVGADGGVFAFGDAQFYGSMGGQPMNASVAGIAATPDGKGYWLVGADGGVFTFGDAQFYGSNGSEVPTPPVAAIVPTVGGRGYWLLEPDGVDYSFSALPSPPASALEESIVSIAASQVAPDPDVSAGAFCNPYGPCEEWCALFATWVWQQAGIPIPSYPFVGSVYDWVRAHGLALTPNQVPAPGDAVFYGTGPATVATSVHIGIVAQVWPEGFITTVEGDAGPGPVGKLSVVVNGPFLPSDSASYNGFPIYAFGQPVP